MGGLPPYRVPGRGLDDAPAVSVASKRGSGSRRAGTFRVEPNYYGMANTHLEPSGSPMPGPIAPGSLDLPADLARAIDLAQERKGRDLLLLDLRQISDATDFFLLVTGSSDLHVRAIAEHILEELRKEGVRPGHVEGMRGGRWVLLDYIDFVVHVFHPGARDFYQLERLWGDAPAHHLEE